MIQLTRDYALLFEAYATGTATATILYGVTPDGGVFEVFDATDQVLHVPRTGEWTRWLVDGSYSVQVGDDFVFPYVVGIIRPGESRPAPSVTMLARLSDDGIIDYAGALPDGWGPVGFGAAGGRAEISRAATAHDGKWFASVGFAEGGQQLIAVDSGGVANMVTSFAEPPNGFVATEYVLTSVSVGDDLYLVADRRFPPDQSELYRITDTGAVDLVFENATAGVYDLESFAGAAWFTTWEPGGTYGFYRVEEGTVEPLAFPDWQHRAVFAALVMTVLEGRLFLYGHGFIGEVAADGSVRTVMDVPFAYVDGIALLDGQIYFSDMGAGQLYRLDPAGTPTLVPLPGERPAPRELTVVDGQLYFSASATKTGSFGEPVIYQALYALDPDGTVTRLTGPDTMAPEIYDFGALHAFAVDAPDGPFGTPGADTLTGSEGDDGILGYGGNDLIRGLGGNDRIEAGNGADTVDSGAGNDLIRGGEDDLDLRDVIFAGDGNDTVLAGAGNDEVSGGNGDDLVFGEAGSDTLIGNDGRDTLSGGGLSDVIFGGPGGDYINGGFGFDRLNGGVGADTFFHLGVPDHGSDWIQDYDAAGGDILAVGIAGATQSQFQVNVANTPNAGAADVAEAFVIYRPTGQILFALVDGAAQGSVRLLLDGQATDLVF